MSDMTLYSISKEFEYIVDLLERDVLEEEEKENLQKMLKEKIQQNSKDIISYHINEQAKIDVLKNEISRLQSMKKTIEERTERYKDKLSENMRKLNIPKIETALGNITLSLDSVNKSVALKEGVDINTIPEQYVKITKELKKTDIKNALKDGIKIEGIEIIETPSRAQFRLSKEAKEMQEKKAGE